MSWVAVAVGVGTAVSAGSAYMGAKKQAGAAKDAANLQMQQFQTINQQQQPFIQSGYGAMGRLNTLLGLNPRPTPAMSTPLVGGDSQGVTPMNANTPFGRMMARMIAQRQGGAVSAPSANTPMGRMIERIRAQQGSASSGNAYMPTPGGGVQPIMTNGPTMYTGNPTTGMDQGNPFGIPSNAGNINLSRILQLRAQHGDSEAARMLGVM